LSYLNSFDYAIIAVYFSILVGLGLYLRKKASSSIEDYFIGGRRIPWWALGISGMASWLDMTGTMIVVSFVYMVGPRGLFIEGFRGAGGLVLVIALLWMGKWHRRSQCLTAAEWTIFRFGDGLGGRMAQLITVVGMEVLTVGLLAYLITGVGLFLSMFLPFSPLVCAIIMISVATVYTMVSGFYGVVFTDMFQSVIILAGVIFISITAWLKITDTGMFAALASQATGNDNWISSVPHWQTTMPKGYEGYRFLIIIAAFYLFKEMFRGMSAGADPKYFGARNDRECGLLSFLWGWMMMFRWPLIMGFAVLGIFLVNDLFPDQSVLTQASALIKQNVPGITKPQWTSMISEIVNHPQNFSQDLIAQLQSLLGADDWGQKLKLLSFEGTVNPERILPAVLLFSVNPGFRGLLLVALIAASMSSFDSWVNMATGFLTRDVYQKYIRPRAKTKELIYASWGFVLLLVVAGFIFATTIESINDIWSWIIVALVGGLLVPATLRYYWWRINGTGYAIATAIGLCGAVGLRLLYPGLDEFRQFFIIITIGFAATIFGSLITKPTDRKVLENFYRKTRPFGLWGPFKGILSDEVREKMQREHRNDLLAVPFTLLWQVTLLLLPMQLVIHSFKAFGVTLVLFIIGLAGMYIFWYRNLPPADERDEI